MDRISFSQGQAYRLDGELVEVVRRLEPNRVQLENQATGDIITEQVEDLLDCYDEGRLVVTDLYGTPMIGNAATPPIDASHANQRERLEGFLRMDVLTYFRRMVGGPLTRKGIASVYEDAAGWVSAKVAETAAALKVALAPKHTPRTKDDDQAPVPPRFKLVVPTKETIYAWERRQRKADGDAMSLMPAHRNKGRKGDRTSDEARELMDQLIRDRYLTRQRLTMRHVFLLMKAEAARLNATRPKEAHIVVPSYTTLRNRIRACSAFEVCVRRYGPEAARRKFQHRGVGEVTTRIQQRYEVDHMRFDVVVIDRRWRIPLGRPWLTLILDRHSRMPVGYYIGFETPNAYSVLRALKSALLPKNRLLKRFVEVVGSWPCWGICEELVTDNGMELHSGPLRRAALELGITLTFCGARDPQGKGTIERFFRTMAIQLVHLLPGTTRSNAKDRGDTNPAHEARVDLENLERVVLKYLVDVYMRQHHERLGDQPVNVWQESAKLHPPVLHGDAERLKLSLALTKTMKLREEGICFEGLRYTSPELTKIRRRAALKLGSTPNMIVKIDPDDLMSIHVALKGQQYLKVPHACPEYAEGLTMAQHRAIRTHDRKRVKASDQATLLESKLQLQAMVDALYAKPKAGGSSVTKKALKEALKAVNDFTPQDSVVKKTVSTVKKIGTYLSEMFQSPYLDTEDQDYEVSFSTSKSRAPAKGGAQ